jgi:hypothetical protein
MELGILAGSCKSSPSAIFSGIRAFIFLQVSHIVGITAPAEFVDDVKSIVESHYEGMTLDRVLAYQ